MLTVDVAADIVASGIKVVILLVSVLVVPSLLVGLLVSVFQAVTRTDPELFAKADCHAGGAGRMRQMDDYPVA